MELKGTLGQKMYKELTINFLRDLLRHYSNEFEDETYILDMIEVILGLKNPFPNIRKAIPRYKKVGVSIAMEAWPSVINKAPITTALR